MKLHLFTVHWTIWAIGFSRNTHIGVTSDFTLFIGPCVFVFER